VARGDTVKKGDIVAYLYRPCSQTDLARMKLNLQRSEEAMQSGISQRQAQIRQLEDQAATETDSREKEILRLTVEYKKTELELFRYEQQRAIDSQKEKIAYYDPIPVIASMDGTVSNLKAKPEEPVSRDALLLTIQDDSVWYLRLKRNSTDYVYHLPLTVEASVKSTDGKADMIYELTGKLITASNVVPKSASNTDGGTFYFMLDPGQTMPENVSYYSICGSLRQLDDVLYLPESAFLNRNHHHAYVQVVLPDGSTEQRLVTLGFDDAFYNHMSVTGITRYYWVVDGVSEGETVILWE
jgi:multidrug efflux pump subunit AcrA (membrane-fusion protein)